MQKVSLWLCAITVLCLLSCNQDDRQEDFNINNTKQLYNTDFTKQYLGKNELSVMPYRTNYLLEGDIMISNELLSEKPFLGKSAGLNRQRWSDNMVYYTIASDMPLSKKRWIDDAIIHWEANTNLRFQERTNQSNYVDFVNTNDNFCTSFVGMIGGRQEATVGNCSTGVMIHEIGHAIGLFHEHNRSDRDQYVRIVSENIQPGFENAFSKYTARGIDGTDYTATLDFMSIMMYFPTAFSVNGNPTITKLDGSSYQWQQQVLSEGDIEGINIMYPTDGTGGGNGEVTICDMVEEWNLNTTYNLGDRVVYLGNLFEKTSINWTFIASCDEGKNIFSGKLPGDN